MSDKPTFTVADLKKWLEDHSDNDDAIKLLDSSTLSNKTHIWALDINVAYVQER